MLWAIITGLGILAYYFIILTDAHLNPFQPVSLGLTFNSMLEHLLRGEFDVSPEAVRFEGFTRDGKVYAYWGIFCALIRMPLMLFPGGINTDVTFLSCLVAACLGTFIKLRLLWTIRSKLPRSLIVLAALYVTLAGASLGFLKASVYQEVLYWAEALASAFIFLAIKGLVSRKLSVLLLSGMAVFAGLGLLTRVTFGIGMGAATGFLLLSMLVESRGRMLFSSRILIPISILAFFVLLTGVVNFYRWGSPFLFMYSKGYNLHEIYPDRLLRQQTYGDFNIIRIPYSIDYYFGFLWALRNDAGFLFQNAHHRLFDVFELPPGSFILSELFPFTVLLAGIVGALRRHLVLDWRKTAAIAAGLCVQASLILCAISTAYRYRMDFYPLFEFLLFVGLVLLGRSGGAYLLKVRSTLTAAVVVSVISAHAELALYKLSPLGTYDLNVPSSLIDYYLKRARG